MAVLLPLKLIIDNYPDDLSEQITAINNPEDDPLGHVKSSKILYIEQDDFRENPPPKYHRLYPGNEVRLRYAYLVKCIGMTRALRQGSDIKIPHCTYHPSSRGGDAPDGRKVKSTIHWVSLKYAIKAEVRLYEQLFTVENP